MIVMFITLRYYVSYEMHFCELLNDNIDSNKSKNRVRKLDVNNVIISVSCDHDETW